MIHDEHDLLSGEVTDFQGFASEEEAIKFMKELEETEDDQWKVCPPSTP